MIKWAFYFGPILRNIMVGECDRSKPLTSWPEAKERLTGGYGPIIPLEGMPPMT
jgi:hypothetical protein